MNPLTVAHEADLDRPGATGGPEADPWAAARSAAVVADASTLGLLSIDGADAAEFLQGQLSNDVKRLGPGQGQWTTYNSPKGRMLATLFLIREPAADRYLAILAADLVESVRKRLSMFVLRSKVRVTPAAATIACGVGGPRAAEAIRDAFGDVPSSATVGTTNDAVIVHLPDGRFVVAAAEAAAGEVRSRLAMHATPAGDEVWAWLAVRSGVPMITASTQDLFVAQTANWDALGGLDFRKGCFTGQEIVARTQHLGRLKERLFAFRTQADAPAPATRLFGEPFGDQAAGTVVNSAPDPEGGSRFLAVAQIQAAQRETMAIGAPDGPPAQRESLPYDVPDPTPPRGRLAR